MSSGSRLPRPVCSLALAFATIAASAALAAPLGAQIIKVNRSTSPSAWLSASAGLFQPRSVNDGTHNAVWQFSDALQWRGALEIAMANQGSFGVAATYARVPLTYYDDGSAAGGACAGNGCDAHATMWSALASFHMGGGSGFHQVIDLSAGAMGYQDFTADAGDLPIGPSKVDLDFAFGIGYGFGYSLSPRFQIALVQDYTAVLHQKENLPGGASTLTQHYTTRLGVRYGIGTRSRL